MAITVVNSQNEKSRFDPERLTDSLKRSMESSVATDRARTLSTAIQAVEGAGVTTVSTDSIRFGIGEVALNPVNPDVKRITEDIVGRSKATPSGDEVALTLNNDTSFARAFMAGVLGGISRFVSGANVDEYFGNLMRQIVEESRVPDQMIELMRKISRYYESLTSVERAVLTGMYANLDVQAPADLKAVTSLPAIFGLQDRQKKGQQIFQQQAPAATTCCEELRLIFDWIKVVKTTWLPGKDSVAVSAVSEGNSMTPEPSSFRWPLNLDGSAGEFDLDDGEETSPGTIIAKVTHWRQCQIRLNTTLTLWLVRFNNIDKAVRQAVAELTDRLSAASGMTGAPPSTGNLVRQILDAILDKLGLRDQTMDIPSIGIAGGLGPRPNTPDTFDIKNLQIIASGFQPPTYVDTHTVTMEKTVLKFSGEWRYRLKAVVIG